MGTCQLSVTAQKRGAKATCTAEVELALVAECRPEDLIQTGADLLRAGPLLVGSPCLSNLCRVYIAIQMRCRSDDSLYAAIFTMVKPPVGAGIAAHPSAQPKPD